MQYFLLQAQCPPNPWFEKFPWPDSNFWSGFAEILRQRVTKIHWVNLSCAFLLSIFKFEPMYIVAIAWIYVALMMAVAEATNTNGTLLGGIVTFILYGILPTSIIIYIMGAPQRKKARLVSENSASEEPQANPPPNP
jgi:hypothetical protein